MRVKTLLLSMAWLSIANGAEIPPGFPFQAAGEDSTAAYTQQGVDIAGALETNQAPIQGENNPNGNLVQSNAVIPQPTVSQPQAEQPVEKAPEESEPEKPILKHSQKKRPRILDKPLENVRRLNIKNMPMILMCNPASSSSLNAGKPRML